MDFWVNKLLFLGGLAGLTVIIGVVLEGAELFVKRMTEKKVRRWTSRHLGLSGRRKVGALKSFIHLNVLEWETIGFSLLVAGLAIELICTTTAEVLQSRQSSALETQNLKLSAQIELMRSNNVADEKNVEAIRAENIAVTKQLNDSIQSELELEKALFPRTISWNKLPFLGTKFAIAVKPAKTDDPSEAQELSKQLERVLFDSGWVPAHSLWNDGQGGICPDGVTIVIKPGTLGPKTSPSVWRSVKAAQALVSELGASHIMTRFITVTTGPQDDTVEILIGRKPDIYEIRNKRTYAGEAF